VVRLIRTVVKNLRKGRAQKLLAASTAFSAPPLAFEIYLEHEKGSFSDPWMWTPIVLAPPLTVVGVAAAFSPRVARTALPAVSALFVLDGVAGLVTHVRGIHRRPGGFRETAYNLVMGPPLLAPGALLAIGALGLLAPLMERER
jgi:hypothetical protein